MGWSKGERLEQGRRCGEVRPLRIMELLHAAMASFGYEIEQPCSDVSGEKRDKKEEISGI
jgi:hypothetical protein